MKHCIGREGRTEAQTRDGHRVFILNGEIRVQFQHGGVARSCDLSGALQSEVIAIGRLLREGNSSDIRERFGYCC